jgi:hypothetical protein
VNRPNQRAAIVADLTITGFIASGLRRFPRCHGIAGISVVLAVMTDFSQRRSFCMTVLPFIQRLFSASCEKYGGPMRQGFVHH